MSTQSPASITIEPIVSYPREAEPGKTYLMTVDLRFPLGKEEWPYDEEEHEIYCLLDSAPLFDNEELGETVIVLHRFGGTYGPAMFLLTANQVEMTDPAGAITLTLANRQLMPLQSFKLDKIRVSSQLAPSLAEQRILRPPVTVKTLSRDTGVEKFLSSDVKAARAVDSVAEAAAAPESFEDDDIGELEFESEGKSWKQWMTMSQLREMAETQQQPPEVEAPVTDNPPAKSNWMAKIALKSLKILGFDLPENLNKKGQKQSAAMLAKLLETRWETKAHPFGLYHFSNPMEIKAGDLIEVKQLDNRAPYLIFLHGLAPSSVVSFGKLAYTDQWERLRRHYGNRILTFEHGTFSLSPIRNALDLAKRLPEGARLHLVTHSRGGLIGELLCLSQSKQLSDTSQLKDFQNRLTRPFGKERQREQKNLRELVMNLSYKRFRVERFVRVACPIRGTGLAAQRMDVLASLLLNSMSLLPGLTDAPQFDLCNQWLKAALLGLIKNRAKPEELPGIEAFSPASPLISLLNSLAITTQADLAVIAGGVKSQTLMNTALPFFGSAFFREENDLIVNTRAMSGGLRRANKAYSFTEQEVSISHFSYFDNAVIRAKMTQWLLRGEGEVVPGFRDEQEASAEDARSTGDRTIQSEAAVSRTLRVSVVHGDLRQASHPVAIGHFQDDIITGSEKVLDQALGGRLSQRFQTGIYPWAEGTNEVILLEGNQPSGALVIGLGDFGELTREKLRDGVARAALRHALAIAERSEKESSATSGPRSAAFSSLLIGSFTGDALSVASSAQAIIEGALEANRALSAQNLSEQVLVDSVEIVELYEDIAIQALRAVRDFAERLPGQMDRGIRVEVAPQHLISRQGGLPQRPPSFSSVNRWLRLLISGAPARQAEESGHVASSFAAELRFQTADKQEAVVTATQRQLVDSLIASSVQQTIYDERLGRTLSELLIPVSFISQAASQTDLLLILDREAARYPWEMLTLPEQSRPLALSHGMIRQFKNTGSRPAFHSQRERNVLVIGDADGKGLADLPGARAEAEEVTKTLNAIFKVWSKIKAPAIETIEELFAREYRILHIAAHASYDEKSPERSGIALGDGFSLTAAELRQLSVMPDVVFINCGHLGRIDGSPASSAVASLPHLSASLAEELIRMGVRIVITAGWAVDDQAAITFASTFYEEMLNGIVFGDAVSSARQACFSRHPRVNTWGAYQCYGDPDFRLGGSRPTVA